MSERYAKYHALGNDYLVLNTSENRFRNDYDWRSFQRGTGGVYTYVY